MNAREEREARRPIKKPPPDGWIWDWLDGELTVAEVTERRAAELKASPPPKQDLAGIIHKKKVLSPPTRMVQGERLARMAADRKAGMMLKKISKKYRIGISTAHRYLLEYFEKGEQSCPV